MPAPTPTKKGITTIVWGTANTLGSPSGAIVESVAVSPKNGGPLVEIEDNNSAGAALVVMNDGFNAKVTCVYDSAKAWPAEGANTALTLADTANANANAITYYCTCVGVTPPSYQRKGEAKISFDLLYRPGITP